MILKRNDLKASRKPDPTYPPTGLSLFPICDTIIRLFGVDLEDNGLLSTFTYVLEGGEVMEGGGLRVREAGEIDTWFQ